MHCIRCMKNLTFETPVELLAEYSTGALEYSTQAAHNSNLPNLIVSDVALPVQIIRELYSAHEKCDV